MTSAKDLFSLGIGLSHVDDRAAATAFESYLRKDPLSSPAWANLSYCYARLDEHEKQFAAAKRACKCDPSASFAWHALGSAEHERGNCDKALRDANRALKLDDSFHLAWDLKGLCLLEQAKVEEALNCFQRACALAGPRVPLYSVHCGRALLKLGEFQKALECANSAIAAKEKMRTAPEGGLHASVLEGAYLLKGLSLLLLGKASARQDYLVESGHSFDEIIRHVPSQLKALVGKAEALIELGKLRLDSSAFKNALDALSDALAIAPDDGHVLRLQGHCFDRLGDKEASLSALLAAASALPGDRGLALDLLSVKLTLRRAEDVVVDSDKMIAAGWEGAIMWNTRGAAFQLLGKVSEAEASYRRATEIDGTDPIVWSNLGQVLEQLGRSSEALACFNKSVKLDRAFLPAWLGMALCLLWENRVPDAVKAVSRAWQALGSDPKAMLPFAAVDEALADRDRLAATIESLENRLHDALANEQERRHYLSDCLIAQASARFEDEVASYLREKYSYIETHTRYRPGFMAGKELDVYTRKGVGRHSDVTVCECKLRLNPEKSISPVEIQAFVEKTSLVHEYESRKAQQENKEFKLRCWFVSNARSADPAALREAAASGIELLRAYVPEEFWLRNDWALRNLEPYR